MDEQIVELLRDKIDRVDAKVDEVRADVKEMLAFKWQIVGGSLVCSVLASVLIQFLINFWGK